MGPEQLLCSFGCLEVQLRRGGASRAPEDLLLLEGTLFFILGSSDPGLGVLCSSIGSFELHLPSDEAGGDVWAVNGQSSASTSCQTAAAWEGWSPSCVHQEEQNRVRISSVMGRA